MKLRSLLTLSAIVLAGCASGPVQMPFVESGAPLAAPPADMAQIVFLDPANAIQGAFPAWVSEVHGADHTLLAVMGPHSKSVQLVAPGHHVFSSTVGGAVAAHIMEADVVAGKRYYVVLRFIYARGMQLRPVRRTGSSEYAETNKEFADWMSSTSWFVKTPAADVADQKHAADFSKAQADGLMEWQKKLPAQRAELTLNVEDTIDR